jgi:hypothetical protein
MRAAYTGALRRAHERVRPGRRVGAMWWRGWERGWGWGCGCRGDWGRVLVGRVRGVRACCRVVVGLGCRSVFCLFGGGGGWFGCFAGGFLVSRGGDGVLLVCSCSLYGLVLWSVVVVVCRRLVWGGGRCGVVGAQFVWMVSSVVWRSGSGGRGCAREGGAGDAGAIPGVSCWGSLVGGEMWHLVCVRVLGCPGFAGGRCVLSGEGGCLLHRFLVLWFLWSVGL